MTRQTLTDSCVVERMHALREILEARLDSDVIAFTGEIVIEADNLIRDAVERRLAGKHGRRDKLTVVLETPGGYIEVVQRIVDTFRRHYAEVDFIVPNHAMSAGAVLVMSGDNVYMDYYSVLGRIDPQVPRIAGEGFVPAVGYLLQYDRLMKKAEAGELNTVESAILLQFDQAELYRYEQARNLTITLLKDWLVKYKFKNWHQTQTRKLPVDHQMRVQRAEAIAKLLNDTERWHSHGRGLSLQVARNDLQLIIEDFGEDPELSRRVRDYHGLFIDYTATIRMDGALHTSEHYWPWAHGGKL